MPLINDGPNQKHEHGKICPKKKRQPSFACATGFPKFYKFPENFERKRQGHNKIKEIRRRKHWCSNRNSEIRKHVQAHMVDRALSSNRNRQNRDSTRAIVFFETNSNRPEVRHLP